MTEEITITILDKTFQVKCAQEKVNALRHAAEHLNNTMRKMRQSGVVGMERIAVISALNLSNELLEVQHQRDEYIKTTTTRIRELQARIDDALTKAEQLELNEVGVSE